jgi:hypothetical protein
MGPNGVVVLAPALDDDLGFSQRVEDLAIEQFVAQASIEALDIAVFPEAARLDIGRLGPDGGDPFLHRLGDKLRPVIGPDVARHPAKDEEVGQDIDHVDRLELTLYPDRQTFVGELVDHVEHAVFAAIVGAVLDEVIGPDVVGMLGPQTNARAVREPKTAAFGLLSGHLQSLTPPDPFYPAVADRPAGLAQQGGNLAIAIAAILARQFDDIGRQSFGILSAPRDLALRRAMLPERRTGAALGDVQMLTNMLDAGATPRGAQKFPLAASVRISLSSVRSETALRNRLFSSSRFFSRFT